jgi:hypothetical protein
VVLKPDRAYAREHWAKPGENPPVGLILCAEKGTAEAHDALDNLPNKILAAECQTVLPDEKPGRGTGTVPPRVGTALFRKRLAWHRKFGWFVATWAVLLMVIGMWRDWPGWHLKWMHVSASQWRGEDNIFQLSERRQMSRQMWTRMLLERVS